MTRPTATKAGHLHDCPGGCGSQLLLPGRACVDCEHRLPGPIRARLADTAPHRRADPAQYQDACAAALDWFRDNPREAAA